MNKVHHDKVAWKVVQTKSGGGNLQAYGGMNCEVDRRDLFEQRPLSAPARPSSCRSLLRLTPQRQQVRVSQDGEYGAKGFRRADQAYQQSAQQFLLRPRFGNAYPEKGNARQDRQTAVTKQSGDVCHSRVDGYRRGRDVLRAGRARAVPGYDRGQFGRHIFRSSDRSVDGSVVFRSHEAQTAARSFRTGGGAMSHAGRGAQLCLEMAGADGENLYARVCGRDQVNDHSRINSVSGQRLFVLTRALQSSISHMYLSAGNRPVTSDASSNNFYLFSALSRQRCQTPYALQGADMSKEEKC